MSIIVLLLVLLWASYHDIKTLTIPLYLWPIPIVFKMVWNCFHSIPFSTMKWSFLIGLCTFFVFFLASYWTNFGGADALLFTSIAFVMDQYVLYCILFSFLFSIPFILYLKISGSKEEYPFVPFMFLGTAFTSACILIGL